MNQSEQYKQKLAQRLNDAKKKKDEETALNQKLIEEIQKTQTNISNLKRKLKSLPNNDQEEELNRIQERNRKLQQKVNSLMLQKQKNESDLNTTKELLIAAKSRLEKEKEEKLQLKLKVKNAILDLEKITKVIDSHPLINETTESVELRYQKQIDELDKQYNDLYEQMKIKEEHLYQKEQQNQEAEEIVNEQQQNIANYEKIKIKQERELHDYEKIINSEEIKCKELSMLLDNKQNEREQLVANISQIAHSISQRTNGITLLSKKKEDIEAECKKHLIEIKERYQEHQNKLADDLIAYENERKQQVADLNSQLEEITKTVSEREDESNNSNSKLEELEKEIQKCTEELNAQKIQNEEKLKQIREQINSVLIINPMETK